MHIKSLILSFTLSLFVYNLVRNETGHSKYSVFIYTTEETLFHFHHWMWSFLLIVLLLLLKRYNIISIKGPYFDIVLGILLGYGIGGLVFHNDSLKFKKNIYELRP